MEIDWLGLVSRVAHTGAAITAIGGVIFMRLALHPSLASLPEDSRAALTGEVRRRWAKWVGVCIGLLLLSGFYNFFATVALFRELGTKAPSLYQMLFGVKFLAALGVFVIASIMAGRSAATERFRRQPVPLLNAAIALAALIVVFSAVLRSTHIAPTSLIKAPPVAAEAGVE